jgi:hypothetical protein
MEEPRRVFVSIYCQVFGNAFSEEMHNRMASGEEIYEFLMKDAGLCRDDDHKLIPGDCNLWYLGCNEKFGCLKYRDKVLSWNFGESSFARVTVFIGLLFKDGIFTIDQFRNLFDKVLEGRRIDCMYDIKDYLLFKREGRPWVKTHRARQFRTNIKGFVARVERHFENEGSLLHNVPTVH